MIRALTDDERDAAAEAQALPDLTLLVAQLHRCREDSRIVSERYAALVEGWQAEHADLIRQCVNLQDAVAVADKAVRAAATEAHGLTGDKHPAPGLTVREHTKLAYDEWTAMRWCRESLPVAVVSHDPTLNRKVFEATVQALGLAYLNEEEEADWITQETTYDVAIDRDLGKALVEEGAMTQALATTQAPGALATEQPRRGIAILDVYCPGGLAAPTHTLDAIATISAGYRKEVDSNGQNGEKVKRYLPQVSRDGTIYIHDPAGRAPRLKEKLAEGGNKSLQIAFPFDDPAQFIQQRFMRYTSTRLEVYGDQDALTEITKEGKHVRYEKDTERFDQLLLTCKNATSVYFTGAAYVDGKPKVQLWDGLGFYRLRTTGRHSIRALDAQIRLCQDLTGGQLAGAPFRLALDYRDVAGPDGAQRNVPVWTITLTPPEQLELDPERFVLVMSAALQQGRTLLKLAAPRPETIEDHQMEVLALGAAIDEDEGYAEFSEMLDEDPVVVEGQGVPEAAPAIEATATQVEQMVSGEAPCDPQPYIAAWHSAVRDTPYASNEARRTWIFAYTEGRAGGQTDSLAEFLGGSARVTAASEREASGLIVAIGEQLGIDEQARIRERTDGLLGGRSALAFLGAPTRDDPEPPPAPPAPEPPPGEPQATGEPFRACTDQQWADIEQWVSGRARASLKRETLSYEDAAQILEEWKPKGSQEPQ